MLPLKTVTASAPKTAATALGVTSPAALGLHAATSGEAIGAAWRLVHNEYVRAGILHAPRPNGVHAPAAWLQGAPYVFVASRELGTVDATLSLAVARVLPADGVPLYAQHLARLREGGARLGEIGLMARNSSGSVQRTGLGGASTRQVDAGSTDAVVGLFGAAVSAARREGLTHLVLTVHPRHERYYRAFGFERLAGEVPHPSVDGARAVLLVRDMSQPLAGRAAAVERATVSSTPHLPNEAARREAMGDLQGRLGTVERVSSSERATPAALAAPRAAGVPVRGPSSSSGALAEGMRERGRGIVEGAQGVARSVAENPGTTALVVVGTLGIGVVAPVVLTAATLALAGYSGVSMLYHEGAALMAADATTRAEHQRASGGALLQLAMAAPGVRAVGLR